jgi:hypothetical protein
MDVLKKEHITMIVSGWTEARYWGYIRSGLRRMFQRYPNKYKCLAASKVGRGQYMCVECKNIHKNKDVSVDHIIPCGSLKKWEDVTPFMKALFCPLHNLQVLCKECHYTKTMHERGMTDTDIEVAKFKKRNAKSQRNELLLKNVTPATNEVGRLEQYREVVDNDSRC